MLGLRNSFCFICITMAIVLSVLICNDILSVEISILIVIISTIVIHIFDERLPKKCRKERKIISNVRFTQHSTSFTFVLLFIFAQYLIIIRIIQIMVDFYYSISVYAILLMNFLISSIFLSLFLLIIIPFILNISDNKITFKKYIKNIRLSSIRPISSNIFIGISCSIIYFISSSIFTSIFSDFTFKFKIIDETFGLHLNIIGWSLFITMLIPAIYEEIAFRGVVLRLNLENYSQKASLLIVSVLFGLFHVINFLFGQSLEQTLLQIIYATCTGYLLGYMCVKTNSLLPSMVTHYLINTVGQLFTSARFPNLFSYFMFGIIGAGLIPMLVGMGFINILFKNQKFAEKYDKNLIIN